MNLANNDYYIVRNIPEGRREIGDEAVWSLSTAKQDSGVHQLRDDNPETFWQSDGPIPHVINIQFMKKTPVSEVGLLLESKTDESYTPQVICVRGGVYLQNLKDIVKVELNNPNGWVLIPLKTRLENGQEQPFVHTMNIQIAILQMFHQGKDTHVRQVKVFGHSETAQKLEQGETAFGGSLLNQYLR